jgi:molybdopterin converting factor small subunit
MKVTVKFFGPLGEQTGQNNVVFVLAPEATFGHLLDAIGEDFGPRFHPGLWDAEQKVFKPGILVLGTGRDLNDREMPLQEGEEIKVVPLLGGG